MEGRQEHPRDSKPSIGGEEGSYLPYTHTHGGKEADLPPSPTHTVGEGGGGGDHGRWAGEGEGRVAGG